MTPAVAPSEKPSLSTMSLPNTVVPPCPARLAFTRDDFLSSKSNFMVIFDMGFLTLVSGYMYLYYQWNIPWGFVIVIL